jgi:hypothetical protein
MKDTYPDAYTNLRSLLYDTGKYIQRVNFSETRQTERALQKLEQTIETFECQAIVNRSLSLSLTHIIADCRIVTNPQARIVCWIKLLHGFNEFIAFNLEQLDGNAASITQICDWPALAMA